jgi:prefoldin subunit 5
MVEEKNNNKDYVLSLIRSTIKHYHEQLVKVNKELRTLRVEAEDLRSEIAKLENSENDIIEKWN